MSCAQLDAVEALHDGRTDGEARARVEAHVRACAACAAHQRSLRELGRRMAALPTTAIVAPELQRRKQALLAALESRRRTGRERALLGLVLGSAALAGATMALMQEARVETRVTGVEVTADVVLAREEDETTSAAPLAVRTAETPSASAALPAATSTPATPRAGAAIPAAAATNTPPANAAAPATSTPPASRPHARAPHERAVAAHAVPPPPAPDALGPDDDAREDADYLDLVDLLRVGDLSGARTRARRYLADHPGGFRRPEVERILSTPDP